MFRRGHERRRLNAPTLPPLRDVIARHGIGARKRLGQHFLLDLNLTRRIAAAAGDLGGAAVIEIGPGPGGLTRALLETDAPRILAIERDRRCLKALEELAAAFPGRLEILAADALDVDPVALTEAPRHIVANLPYNIATPLLIRWLSQAGAYAGLTLMFQKEVAQRLAAPPGGKTSGRLSVLAQWLCEVRLLFDVSPRAFTPPPKVTSSVVALTPRPAPLFEADQAVLQRVTGAAFGQRRKMLRASLKTLGTDTERLIAEAGVASTARAEELSVAEFCALARALSRLSGPGAGA